MGRVTVAKGQGPALGGVCPVPLCSFFSWEAGWSLTHTADACEVQAIAKGTLAAKGAIGVDTMAIGTDARILCTLIHICEQQGLQTQCLSCPGHIEVLFLPSRLEEFRATRGTMKKPETLEPRRSPDEAGCKRRRARQPGGALGVWARDSPSRVSSGPGTAP